MERLLDVRRVVTGALEVKRRDKEIRSSLEAKPIVYIDDSELRKMIDPQSFADFVITSDFVLAEGKAPAHAFRLEDGENIAVMIDKADGDKCARCWKYTETVGDDTDHPEICARCAAVVKGKQSKSAA